MAIIPVSQDLGGHCDPALSLSLVPWGGSLPWHPGSLGPAPIHGATPGPHHPAAGDLGLPCAVGASDSKSGGQLQYYWLRDPRQTLHCSGLSLLIYQVDYITPT